MSKIYRVENRTCPYCKHEYVRNVYRKRSVDSICPKCKRRSDVNHYGPGRYVHVEPTECKNPDCTNTFYKHGLQEYCHDCYKASHGIKRRKYMKEYRERRKREK